MNNKIKGFIEIEDMSGRKTLINVNNIVYVANIEDIRKYPRYVTNIEDIENKGLTVIHTVILTPDSEYTFVINTPYDEVINLIKASQFM